MLFLLIFPRVLIKMHKFLLSSKSFKMEVRISKLVINFLIFLADGNYKEHSVLIKTIKKSNVVSVILCKNYNIIDNNRKS